MPPTAQTGEDAHRPAKAAMPTDPLTRVDQLLSPFEEAYTSPEDFRVGTEAEKFGVDAHFAPVPFEGKGSIADVLAALVDDYGWEATREHAGGDIISLRRDGASVTLEPAAQLELSGAPFRTIHETDAEFARHASELVAVSEPLGLRWLSLGFHPFATHDELPHVPKLRYRIMRSYLPTKGSRALDMMRRTATIQANLDYENADDAMRKLRIALAVQPIVTALCANSPWREGQHHGLLSERADVWLHMDPDRSGILPFAWETDASLEDYVNWALDVPMFLVKRGSKLIENTGQPFRAFMRDGYDGTRAVAEDWVTHINSLFPEARLKNTLEVRGADAQPQSGTCAVPALWKGLLYDEHAMRAAESMITPLDARTVQALRPAVAMQGLQADLLGRPLRAWAAQLIDIAASGLARLADLDADGRDETHFLAPLHARVDGGQTAAEALLASLEGAADPRAQLVEHARLR